MWGVAAASGGGGRAAAEAAAAGGGGGRDRSGGDQLPAPRDARRRALRSDMCCATVLCLRAVSPAQLPAAAAFPGAGYACSEARSSCSAAGGARFVWAAGLVCIRGMVFMTVE